MITPSYDLRRNLRDLPGGLIPSAWLSGLLTVTIGFASSLVLVFQAASNANMDRALLSSWIWALTIGAGATSIIMCLRFRQPVIAAWSTAGAALLVSSLGHYAYEDVIGAYVVAAIATIVLGYSGLFGRVMKLVPQPVVMGMLGGVLLKFGLGLFNALPDKPLLVIGMLVTFFLLRRLQFRAPSIGALVVGLVIAAVSGDIHLEGFAPTLAVPIWTTPHFSLEAILGLSLPLFALAHTSQNAPGLAVLRNAGYEAAVDQKLMITGTTSLLTAPFGGHGITLAAITAAMVANPEAHPDPDRRYAAGVASGIWSIVFGLFGATIVTLFAGLPAALIAATAGLALTGVLISSISGAMANPDEREGGLVALLCTAANFTLLGIGAPFWGLVAGVLVNAILRYGKQAVQAE